MLGTPISSKMSYSSCALYEETSESGFCSRKLAWMEAEKKQGSLNEEKNTQKNKIKINATISGLKLYGEESKAA